jgi:catechol 2,3-dioxygenase-like lactoylglutathione lyase family enzyme
VQVECINPILNVSDITESFRWFEKWGWKKLWEWGTPPTFGSVGAGECEIFLCQGGQGGRGRDANTTTFGPTGDQQADMGVWMSIFVDDVDAVHRQCMAEGIDITFAPADMPWNVREMHVRHPDGHVFRVGTGIEAKA